MPNSRYQKLFEPIKIGQVELKNRFVKSASQTYFFDSGEHRVSRMAKAFYEALARGGAGLITVETPAMEWPLAETGDRRLRLDDDKYTADVSELAEVIHKHGCPAFMQFYHRGSWGGVYKMIAPRIAASSVELYSENDVHEETPPRVMTIEEIEELVERYASYAVRIARAGFDGLEIHSGADTLLATFLSRFWNRREDSYGAQTMENRTRLVVTILKEVKKRLGQDFPVQVMINAMEMGVGDEGLTVAEAQTIAKILQEAGADSIQVRTHWLGKHQGSYHHEVLFYPETDIPLKSFPPELDWSHRGPQANVPLAAVIKQAVSVPVMTVGGLDADSGEKILREGKVDLIGMTRRFFADPEYPNKVLSGRLEDIAPCTHCGECNKVYNQPRRCRINAAFGTEQYEVKPAEKSKKVVIVGGGPAGMQAARVATLRGHDVTLYEKSHLLGGSLPLAAMVKGFEIEDLPALIRYFKTQITKLGVKIRLGKDFSPSVIDEVRPDALVLAAGGAPALPDIPGIDGPNVIKSADLYDTLKFYLRFLGPKVLRGLTRFWMPVGKEVVIIGSAIQGCQLAEFLVKRGRKVTIVDTEEEPGQGLAPERKTRLFSWFQKKGVVLLAGVKLEEITAEGLTFTTSEGEMKTLEANNIIPALPLLPNAGLYEALKSKVPEVYAIGDCKEPGLIPDATAGGWEIAHTI